MKVGVEAALIRGVFVPGDIEVEDGILQRCGLAGGGRGLAVVDRDRLIAVGAMDQHEAAPADVAGARQGDGERKADRDRRIDSVAAAFQYVEPDPRRLRLLGHDHAVPGDDRPRRREWGDDRGRIGEDGGGDEAKECEGERAKHCQSVVL